MPGDHRSWTTHRAGHRAGHRAWLRRLRGAGAIAVALLLMVCTVGVQVQEAAVTHVRCVEHGRLVHVRALSGAGATATRAVHPHLRSGATGSADGHEHCPFVGTNHCLRLATIAIASSTVAARPVTSPPAPREHVARTTFRLAPKTSPPA